jgi:hypothetical protein
LSATLGMFGSLYWNGAVGFLVGFVLTPPHSIGLAKKGTSILHPIRGQQ